MFPSFRSPASSPCPSPVREFAASLRRASSPSIAASLRRASSPSIAVSLRRASSPSKNKYKTLPSPQEPMISKGRLTMTGGFPDLRPQPIDREDSLESEDEGSSSMYSSRSTSCDSGDAVLGPKDDKPVTRYFKVPKRALTAAMGHFSPRLQKKLIKAEEATAAPQHPMWPSVMATYGRGVTTSPVQAITAPSQPSLSAMKAQAILDERRDIRAALQMLACKAELQRHQDHNEDATSSTSEHCDLDDDDDDDDNISFDNDNEDVDDESLSSEDDDSDDEHDYIGNETLEDASCALALHEIFPINPAITVRCPNGRTATPDEGFQEESLLDALDLDAVPTLTPEELAKVSVFEVRNVHVMRDYVVLETAPPAEGVMV